MRKHGSQRGREPTKDEAVAALEREFTRYLADTGREAIGSGEAGSTRSISATPEIEGMANLATASVRAVAGARTRAEPFAGSE